jgi:3D (Asp-Asp-Asp) domain-containing protein
MLSSGTLPEPPLLAPEPVSESSTVVERKETMPDEFIRKEASENAGPTRNAHDTRVPDAPSDASGTVNSDASVDNSAEEAQIITVEATAFTAKCNGCIGITKTGVDVRNTIYHEGKRVIAVDPNLIPLGATVEIMLSNGDSFLASAEDTGGNINGHRIDVLVATKEEAYRFGRQSVKLRILK